MTLDARRLPDGSTLAADLCIVGAGPAGLTLARELSGSGMDVLLLESGGLRHELWTQDLSDGPVTGQYAGLRGSRHRQAGGTAHLWNTPVAPGFGAKYAPLDPWDLDQWPLGYPELLPYYRRAQTICGLGPFEYGASHWSRDGRRPLGLDDGLVSTGIYQFGPARLFTESYPAQLGGSPNVRLCLGATVCGLASNGDGTRVLEAYIGTHSGRRHRVVARRYVLAAGAVENARLLLVSELGNGHDLVGRFFMEHPRDTSLSLIAGSDRLFSEAAFYDRHAGPDGTVVGGRLGLTERAVRELDLPNASVTLLPRLREGSPASARGGYGWSVGGQFGDFDGFRLLINLEQRPHRENRVQLASERDALGVPRARLTWQWRASEQLGLDPLRSVIATALERSGAGRIELSPQEFPDPNAHHHAGTTRMSADQRLGVVDPDCRVHGIENLFVAGASVFPTVGYANPTLTVVAMAVRLGETIRR